MLGNEGIVIKLQELLQAYEDFIIGYAILDKLWSDGRHHLAEYMNLEEFETEFSRYLQEKSLSDSFPCTYEIYQLKDAAHTDYAFRGFDEIKSEGKEVLETDYKQVYEDIMEENCTLDFIYARFNYECPTDFKGHSMSVSDVIVLKKNGVLQAYYVDTFGFKLLEDFCVKKDPALERIENKTYQTDKHRVTTGRNQEMHPDNYDTAIVSKQGMEEKYPQKADKKKMKGAPL